MQHPKVPYLRLAPEFGEYRGGPFEQGEIKVGADAERCDIFVDGFGAFPIHAKIIRQAELDYILTPSEHGAEIFLHAPNAAPLPVLGPTEIRDGDAFSIVTVNGPKFFFELDELPEELKLEREKNHTSGKSGRDRLSKKSMQDEVKRQFWTQLLVLGPMQLLQRAVVFVKSGAIYQPRNIIAGAVLLSGWIVGGSMSCRSRSTSKALVKSDRSLNTCKADVKMYEEMSKSRDYSLAKAVLEVSQSKELSQLLKKDKKLLGLVKEKSLSFFNQERPEWLINGSGAYAKQVERWVAEVSKFDSSEIDNTTQRLVLWMINSSDQSNRRFDQLEDSTSQRSCARGMMRLTYRQARHLGLNTQPDYLYTGPLTNIPDNSDRLPLLQNTVQSALMEATLVDAQMETLKSSQILEESINPSLRQSCLYAEGEDQRTDNSALLRSLKQIIGPSQSGLPASDEPLGPAARIAKIYAADIQLMDFSINPRALEFKGKSLSAAVESLDSQGDWVLERTAKTIARSLVLPCLVALDGEDKSKEIFGEENLPSPIACLVLKYKIENE